MGNVNEHNGCPKDFDLRTKIGPKASHEFLRTFDPDAKLPEGAFGAPSTKYSVLYIGSGAPHYKLPESAADKI